MHAIHIRMHTKIHIRMHAQMRKYTYACMRKHIHIRMHAKMCTYTYACMRKCARMHANTVHYRPAGRWHKDSSSRTRPLASIEWGVTSHNVCVEVSDEWLNLCAHYSCPRSGPCVYPFACTYTYDTVHTEHNRHCCACKKKESTLTRDTHAMHAKKMHACKKCIHAKCMHAQCMHAKCMHAKCAKKCANACMRNKCMHASCWSTNKSTWPLAKCAGKTVDKSLPNACPHACFAAYAWPAADLARPCAPFRSTQCNVPAGTACRAWRCVLKPTSHPGLNIQKNAGRWY
jgi:hypothetical protein